VEREDRGFVAGLAVALGGGAVVVGLMWAFVAATNSSADVKTVTATATAPAATTAAPDTTTPVPASIPANVVAGGYDYVRFACGTCHGWKGEGPNPQIPPLNVASKEFTAAQMRTIIDKGAPNPLPKDPKAPFMPVWGQVISDRQIDNLVAYIQAGLPEVPGALPRAVPSGSSDDAAGAILYEKYGCINCHGPNGLGGVPDPANPEKAIPALTGADFRKEFPPDAIAQVITSGSVLGKQPITSMPHWGGVLTDAEIKQLVAFIETLK
jgi:mono/diheme cytochrome c family protein